MRGLNLGLGLSCPASVLETLMAAPIFIDDLATTTPVATGDTWTSAWVSVRGPQIAVAVKTDQDCTVRVQFSPDGTNIDSTVAYAFDASITGNVAPHILVCGRKYVRIQIENASGANQTYLRATGGFGFFKDLTSVLTSNIRKDADALVVRQIDPGLELAFGRIDGMSEDSKFGSVTLLDAADAAADVWDYASDDVTGTPVHPFPTADAATYIASTASDTVTMRVVGISGGAATTEDIALTGTTEAQLSNNYSFINRVTLLGATDLTGDVTISHDADWTGGRPDNVTQTLAFIRAGDNQTQQALYVVPSGFRMRIVFLNITVARAAGAAGAADIVLRVRESGGTWRVRRKYRATTASSISIPIRGLVFGAGAAVSVRVNDVSDGDTSVSVDWDYELVEV